MGDRNHGWVILGTIDLYMEQKIMWLEVTMISLGAIALGTFIKLTSTKER